MSSKAKERGQVLLIVVLVMIVSLTVGLSVASRSITNLRTAQEEAASQKALFAAEAGLEQYLDTGIAISSALAGVEAGYSTSVTTVGNTAAPFLLHGGNIIHRDEGADLWLSTYSTDPSIIYTDQWTGTIRIYWGTTSNSCGTSALEVTVVSGVRTSPSLTKYAYDPCSTRRGENSFAAPELVDPPLDISGVKFYNRTPVISVNSGLIARVVSIYGDATVGIAVSSPLPLQGVLVSSTGSSRDIKRKINVFKGYPQLPSQYFLYGLFSP